MKVQWRAHELLLVTFFVAFKIVSYLWQMLTLPEEWRANYVHAYATMNVVFDYTRHMLLPQTAGILSLYMCYLWMNRLVVPLLRKLSFKGKNTSLFKNIALIALQVLGISIFFALCINTATYYAQPHIINYGPSFQILAGLGYNDQPLANLFFGIDRALVITALFLVTAIIRESMIYFIERPGVRRDYRILITNQLTSLMVVYLSAIAIILFFDLIVGTMVFGLLFFIPSVLLVYMSNTYWLFPLHENSIGSRGKIRFSTRRIAMPLLFTTLLCTFPFALIYVMSVYHYFGPFLLILFSWWALQLFAITPLSWMLYQQRKDKILQLRGVEKELVNSIANLQFLRSQINPHFLFNSLNTLYGTALLENSDRTAEGIQLLGDMMRFMLHENTQDFIHISREIEYLHNYIALQKLRTQSSPHIRIEDSISENQCNQKIAPMLLIPFIENAFKHGISLQEKSWIHIRLECDQEGIRFQVRNSRHPRKEITPEQGKSGIGLVNVTERLSLLYPGRHTLNIGGDATEFVVHLTVRLHPVSGLMPVANL